MSTYAIKTFHSDLERLKHFGGTNKETAIRFAFQKLLDEYAKAKDLMLIPEVSLKTKTGKTVTPDGTLKDVLRLDHGYWESKDEADDIDEEIKKKFAKSYPNDNIVFEDSSTAVLIQHGVEVMRTAMEDEEKLDKLLTKFVGFERPEITDFRKAIDKFREDIPKVTETLHDIIEKQEKANPDYIKAKTAFHELCKQSINPEISSDDIKEMMVQHILSADIFNTIFDEPHFHQENNIARELNKVIDTFFTGATRRATLATIQHYYQTINAAAAGIADHHEKQMFLKVVYENFYKAYNPKAADRLGIVYTPNEIVQFMIKSTDFLLHKHFGKTLADKNVEILDPATGTGTFICDIIDFLPKNKVAYKYKNELHANELAILPYYIANLNIEYTYKQKTGEYAEFESLCLVDTLDNTGFNWVGKQGDLFGMSAENAVRIKKQNEKKISVIIGNPPYNANQQNESDNNKNRTYNEIDKRIKDTYIKKSTAQKTKVYDMYARFYRWASDRIQDDGVIAFISNNSFLNARTFDGFRKSVQDEFQYAYFIDLGGNIRDLSGKDGIFLGEKNTIFGQAAAVGIAMAFLIKDKRRRLQSCHINYIHPCDIRATRDEKLAFIKCHKLEDIEFDNIIPDKNNNWINLTDNDWYDMIPLASKDVKSGKSNEALFELFSLGVVTNRDEWVYDFNKNNLSAKINFFINEYKNDLEKSRSSNNESIVVSKYIKYTRDLKKNLNRGSDINFDQSKIINTLYRPFTSQYLYYDRNLNEMQYQMPAIFFSSKQSNKIIILNNSANRKDYTCFSSDKIFNNNFNGDPMECLPFYRYTTKGEKVDNITDWGLEKFRHYYYGETKKYDEYLEDYYRHILGKEKKKEGVISEIPPIFKEDIFNYVYAVLHHPAYRKKYELNLKREFPRIPFYKNFWQWAKWGEQLMQLHIEYEKEAPYLLERIETEYDVTNPTVLEKLSKPKLKADKEKGTIELDGITTLANIPSIAWEYKLGNRSAMEWVLDQYKEKKPSDPTIAEKFNSYKFADYKEQVIDLLKRVCTVSYRTMEIINEMPK